MSLDKLSTELNAKITTYLVGDIKSLSALSKTSKYYRTVAEPHLYKEVAFNNQETWQIWCLLRTIIDRGNVALYIKSLALKDPSRDGAESPEDRAAINRQKDDRIRPEVWTRANYITNHIARVMRPFSHLAEGVDLACAWTGHMFSHNWHESLAGQILTHAHNLETLSVQPIYDRYETIYKLLELPWSGTDRPFWKLKALRLWNIIEACRLQPAILLSLQCLSFSGIDLDANLSALTSCLPSQINPVLTTLKLHICDLPPIELRKIIALPFFANLKRFKLRIPYRHSPPYGPN